MRIFVLSLLLFIALYFFISRERVMQFVPPLDGHIHEEMQEEIQGNSEKNIVVPPQENKEIEIPVTLPGKEAKTGVLVPGQDIRKLNDKQLESLKLSNYNLYLRETDRRKNSDKNDAQNTLTNQQRKEKAQALMKEKVLEKLSNTKD